MRDYSKRLLEALSELKDAEGMLAIFLAESYGPELVKTATEKLHNGVKLLEAEYNQAIEERK